MSESRSNSSPLAQRRIEVGLSQLELGERLNKTDQTICNWEVGVYTPRLTLYEFKQLCNALGWQTIAELPNRLGPDY